MVIMYLVIKSYKNGTITNCIDEKIDNRNQQLYIKIIRTIKMPIILFKDINLFTYDYNIPNETNI